MPKGSEGFTKTVTLELGLDQRAGTYQVEERRVEISGLRGLQVQRHGGMTRNNTCEVHSMPETRVRKWNGTG